MPGDNPFVPEIPHILDILHKEWPVIKAAPYSFCISLLCGWIFIWLVSKFLKRLKSDTSKSDDQSKASSNSQSTVTDSGKVIESGNATINQFFGMTHTETGSPAPAATVEEKRFPNLVCIGAEYINLNLGIETHAIYRSETGSGDMRGIIVSFRNEGNKVVTAYNIKATLRFKDSDEKEIGHGISGSLWLGSPHDCINIEPDTCECVVVLVKGHGMFIAPAVEKRMFSYRRYGYVSNDQMLSVLPKTIEIRLRDKGGKGDPVLPEPIVLDISECGDKLSVTVKQSSLGAAS